MTLNATQTSLLDDMFSFDREEFAEIPAELSINLLKFIKNDPIDEQYRSEAETSDLVQKFKKLLDMDEPEKYLRLDRNNDDTAKPITRKDVRSYIIGMVNSQIEIHTQRADLEFKLLSRNQKIAYLEEKITSVEFQFDKLKKEEEHVKIEAREFQLKLLKADEVNRNQVLALEMSNKAINDLEAKFSALLAKLGETKKEGELAKSQVIIVTEKFEEEIKKNKASQKLISNLEKKLLTIEERLKHSQDAFEQYKHMRDSESQSIPWTSRVNQNSSNDVSHITRNIVKNIEGILEDRVTARLISTAISLYDLFLDNSDKKKRKLYTKDCIQRAVKMLTEGLDPYLTNHIEFDHALKNFIIIEKDIEKILHNIRIKKTDMEQKVKIRKKLSILADKTYLPKYHISDTCLDLPASSLEYVQKEVKARGHEIFTRFVDCLMEGKSFVNECKKSGFVHY